MDVNSYSTAITVRPAVSRNADGITRTFLESAVYHAALDAERYAGPALETISSSCRARRGAITFVAEIGSEIVGFVGAHLEESPDLMHREMVYCHVSEIVVRHDHLTASLGRRCR